MIINIIINIINLVIVSDWNKINKFLLFYHRHWCYINLHLASSDHEQVHFMITWSSHHLSIMHQTYYQIELKYCIYHKKFFLKKSGKWLSSDAKEEWRAGRPCRFSKCPQKTLLISFLFSSSRRKEAEPRFRLYFGLFCLHHLFFSFS